VDISGPLSDRIEALSAFLEDVQRLEQAHEKADACEKAYRELLEQICDLLGCDHFSLNDDDGRDWFLRTVKQVVSNQSPRVQADRSLGR
jgi:hypothetical protein